MDVDAIGNRRDYNGHYPGSVAEITLVHAVLTRANCRTSYNIEENQVSRYDTPQNTHLLPLVIDTAKTAQYLGCYVGVILDRHPAALATTHGER